MGLDFPGRSGLRGLTGGRDGGDGSRKEGFSAMGMAAAAG